MPLIDGGTIRLSHLIGLSRALDLILTGRAVKGKEAFTIGLAKRLVPDGSALSSAIQLAVEISKFPQECMNRDRLSAFCCVLFAGLINSVRQIHLDFIATKNKKCTKTSKGKRDLN